MAKQVLDGWGIAHLMNFYSGRLLTPGFGLQYANNTQGVANINSIFTGSPDVGPRIQPTGNPNSGIPNIAHAYEVNAFAIPGIPNDTPDLQVQNLVSRNPRRHGSGEIQSVPQAWDMRTSPAC